MSNPVAPTHRLLVRACTDTPDPRTSTPPLGVLALGEHPHRPLAREGPHLRLIDDMLTDPAHGRTPTERLAALTHQLRTSHGATTVLGVWAFDTASGLRLRASVHTAPTSHADAALLGVIYDTPHTRRAATAPAVADGGARDTIAVALFDEVVTYDHWLNNEVFEWVIEQRTSTGTGAADTWKHLDGGVYYGHTDARIAGEERWRTLVGPLYTEAEPHGPTAVQPRDDTQLTAAYTRRFTRPLTDGELHGVVEVECFVVNADLSADLSATPEPVLTRVLTYTVCIDPDDAAATQVRSYTRHDDAATPRDPAQWDGAARRWCVEFDPAELDWDGQLIL